MLTRPARRAIYHRARRSGELIPQNERELRRSAGSGILKAYPLMREAMLARPARRVTYHRALRSGELIPQNERELRRSAGSGMLKGDPLIRGAMLAPPIFFSRLAVNRGSRLDFTPRPTLFFLPACFCCLVSSIEETPSARLSKLENYGFDQLVSQRD